MGRGAEAGAEDAEEEEEVMLKLLAAFGIGVFVGYKINERAEVRALASDTATKAKLVEAEKQNASWAAQASHAAG